MDLKSGTSHLAESASSSRLSTKTQVMTHVGPGKKQAKPKRSGKLKAGDQAFLDKAESNGQIDPRFPRSNLQKKMQSSGH